MKPSLPKALRRTAAAVAAGAGVLGLIGAVAPVSAGATQINSADIIWGLWGTGPYACSMYVGHEPAYGGALAWSWTPDPYYGGPGCWSSYSYIWATGGSAESGSGNPSSSVLAPGVPNESAHLACYALFDCSSSWYYLP